MIELDPRYEWIEVHTFGSFEPEYLRGPCLHLRKHVVDVESGGEVVARLCTTCDAQLPPTRMP